MSLGYEKVIEALRLANKQQLDETTLASVRQYLREQDDRDEWLKALIQPGTNKINSGSIAFPFQPIYNTVLEKAQADLTIPIPPQYKHLVLMTFGQSDAAVYYDGLVVRFNGDAGTNYHDAYITGSQDTVLTYTESIANTFIAVGWFEGTSGNAASASGRVAFIPHYRSSFWKASYSLGGEETWDVKGQSVGVSAGYWMSTSPIDTITFKLITGNMKAGSLISVYGIL